jgi:hypothetical protein
VSNEERCALSDKDEKRRWLFDLYSENLSFYLPKLAGSFACPLCLDVYSREALDGLNPSVSLAHIIPDSLGGTACTLTCTACNNDNGSDVEKFLTERLIAEDRVAGVGRINARLSGSFGNIGVEWEWSPDQRSWSLYGLPEQSNPAHFAALQQCLTEAACNPKRSFEFSLTPQYRHEPRRTEAAMYQSAYLLMFSYFGYEFAFHPQFQPMRERIVCPGNEGWKTEIAVLSDEVGNAVLGSRHQGVLFLYEPPALVAVLRMCPKEGRKKGRSRVFGVVLTGCDFSSADKVEGKTIKGGIVPYSPEALIDSSLWDSYPGQLALARLAHLRQWKLKPARSAGTGETVGERRGDSHQS